MLRGRAAMGVCALVAAMALVACGSDGKSGGSGSDAKAAADTPKGKEQFHQAISCDVETSIDDLLALKVPKAKERYKITLMEVSLAAYYFQAVAYGAEKAAKEAGVDLTILAGKNYQSPEQQVTQAQNALARGTDAIILGPADIRGAVPVADQAKAKDVPVVVVSSELDSDYPYVVMQDDYAQGKLAAEALLKELPEGGKGIVQGGPLNATWAQKRVAGFMDAIKDHPEIEVSATTNQMVDPAEGLKTFTNAAQAHPQVDWIYAVNNALLPPDSIRGKHREAVYIAGGYEPAVVPALESGQANVIIPANQVWMGYVGMATAIAKLNGEEPPKVNCLPNEPLTKAEMDTPRAQAELYPDGYKAKGTG